MEIMSPWFPFYKVPPRPRGIMWPLGIKSNGKREDSADPGVRHFFVLSDQTLVPGIWGL